MIYYETKTTDNSKQCMYKILKNLILILKKKRLFIALRVRIKYFDCYLC